MGAAPPPMPAPQSPQAGAPGGAAPSPSGNPAFGIFAQISRLADQCAAALPPTSPMMEAIKDQVRLALQKAIQSQAPQQSGPPI